MVMAYSAVVLGSTGNVGRQIVNLVGTDSGETDFPEIWRSDRPA